MLDLNNLRSNEIGKGASCVILILLLGYIGQYNPFYLSEFLWKDYWTGSAIRTSISAAFLTLALLFSLMIVRKSNKASLNVVAILVITGLYGLSLGFLFNTTYQYVIADSLIWFETAAYLFVFSGLSCNALRVFARGIVVYTAIAAVLEIYLFWSIRDEVAIAALIDGERIVRLADLQAPLILILANFKFLNLSDGFRRFATLILSLVILLGFFRSVWAALILSLILCLLLYPRFIVKKKVLYSLLPAGMIFILFEYLYYILTGVPSVLSGRILAGVGTADSLGRLSSTVEVLNQYSDSVFHMIFGNGFGTMVWFVNDFGFGEVRALQPVGSLSNYFVALMYQIGFFGLLMLVFFLGYYLYSFWRTHDIDTKRKVFLFFSYLGLQWLTFPSTIHFPTGLSIALVFAILFTSSRTVKFSSTRFPKSTLHAYF